MIDHTAMVSQRAWVSIPFRPEYFFSGFNFTTSQVVNYISKIVFCCFFKETLIRADDIKQLTKDDLFKWNEVKGARNYICRICGPHINCESLLGDKPSLAIPYTNLKFKSPQTKPDPVQVTIEVLAVGENDVLGRGGPFNLSKYFVTSNILYSVYWFM